MSDASVIVNRDGRIGHILLNRPKALNALDLPMLRAMQAALDEWRDDPAVHAVVIEGAGGRAFCAGGDIRAVRSLMAEGRTDEVEAFFREEYALNATIDEYPKPYVALIDGICMGGGIGVSVHGQMRVTTEAGLFAMPETAIAMFPDVGATFMLPRLPGELGTYLGLTGARMTGAEAVHAGIATHFVPRAALPALRTELARDGVAAVAAHAQTLPPFSLAPHRAAIDRCFGATSVPEIIERLQHEHTDWAQETLATLRTVSPSSVFWSFAAMRRGGGLSLRAALAAELKLTRHVTRHPDFAEGVRAMVIDKDRQPRWSPARMEDVDPAAIAAMLA
ncbi:Enoyl-CoA hydratase/isomerase family protein [Rhodovastum atsumiense]|uniref:3-hydroxyisobutyryl-CoA hydrolase n=1 Tax=Rhodovastum atsumiense TaxID=504468 RepID=A0A5M6IUQ2_9PROT|nr:enoyl-CoA hydratase/isomerase family protein [Rhodovastum atsumiense]KAA5611679.1 enoyl-CoA hydratase/isomerase family protein [Rhodovastum atsumiense]CAH2604251.1 Enoyl-CoA hydratase/isomerase family protein [Rhodovastum atsumiense]